MKKTDLSSVTDCMMIFSNQDFVILSGKNPWIFCRDETFVAKLKAVRNTYNMVFLPGNTVLMDGGVDRQYHYVSLKRGEIIWSYPQKGRRSMTPRQFAVTPDGQTVYYVYEIKNVLHIDRIIPQKQIIETYSLSLGLRATYHSYCDADGNLLMLQSYLVKDPANDDPDQSYFQNGVLRWSPTSPAPAWKHQWIRKSRTGYKPNVCNDEYILFDDFTAASFKTGQTFNLLEENEKISRAPGGFVVSAFDPDRLLLTVKFLHSMSTIIIDCKARKIIAHYRPITQGLSSGCLIGDEFWIGTANGVIKRPFPNMDEFPRRF